MFHEITLFETLDFTLKVSFTDNSYFHNWWAIKFLLTSMGYY